jgi:hypothetical protein
VGATIDSVQPAKGSYDSPTTVTLTGTGLVAEDGRAVAVDVRSSHGRIVACANPTPLLQLGVSTRGSSRGSRWRFRSPRT